MRLLELKDNDEFGFRCFPFSPYKVVLYDVAAHFFYTHFVGVDGREALGEMHLLIHIIVREAKRKIKSASGNCPLRPFQRYG
jgi:hypothetical protein